MSVIKMSFAERLQEQRRITDLVISAKNHLRGRSLIGFACPKDPDGNDTMIAYLGTTPAVYVEPVYDETGGPLERGPNFGRQLARNMSNNKDSIKYLLVIELQMRVSDEFIIYDARRVVDMLQPAGHIGRNDRVEYNNRQHVLPLLVRPVNDNAVYALDFAELAMRQTENLVVSLGTHRNNFGVHDAPVLPTLLLGSYDKPVFDSSNTTLGDSTNPDGTTVSLADQAAMFDAAIIDAADAENWTGQYLVPASVYVNWRTVQNVEYFEGFHKFMHAVEDELRFSPCIMKHGREREESVFEISDGLVHYAVDLWSHELGEPHGIPRKRASLRESRQVEEQPALTDEQIEEAKRQHARASRKRRRKNKAARQLAEREADKATAATAVELTLAADPLSTSLIAVCESPTVVGTAAPTEQV